MVCRGERRSSMNTSEEIKLWARELKAIAQTGLAYGKDVYDLERYQQMNGLSNQMLSYISDFSSDEIDGKLPIEEGYATPKIAVRGIVLKDQQVLMVKETADGLWSLPGGWCDIGFSAAENIEKEIEEETGLRTKATKLLSFYDQRLHRFSVSMQHIYTVYFLCEIVEGKLRGSIETADVNFFSPNQLPTLSIQRVTKKQLQTAIQIAKEECCKIYFD